MTNDWHKQIQRYVDGEASAAEAAALQEGLSKDAELRALYLDYVNLDMALGALAEAETTRENQIGMSATSRRLTARPSLHYGRLLAAIAACAAIFTLAMLLKHRNPSQPTKPDIAATCALAQEAITRLHVEPPSLFPAWASPTASMLDLREF